MSDVKGFQCVFEDYIVHTAEAQSSTIVGLAPTLQDLDEGLMACGAGVTHTINPPMLNTTDELRYGTPINTVGQSNPLDKLNTSQGGKDY